MVFTHDSSINTVLKLKYGGHRILQVHGVCLLQILRFLEIQFLTVVWFYGSGDYDNNTPEVFIPSKEAQLFPYLS